MTLGCHRNPPYRPRFQWDESSGSPDWSQKYNCGPAGATQQADYWEDKHFGIEQTRLLAAGRGRPTTMGEQAAMFYRRTGVGAAVVSLRRMGHLDNLLNRRRPVGLAVICGRMRARTRGHPFTGSHRITLLKKERRRVRRNGRRVWRAGYVYTDPNFSPPGGHRPDPKRGHRWISRRELDYVLFGRGAPAYALAVVPERSKR